MKNFQHSWVRNFLILLLFGLVTVLVGIVLSKTLTTTKKNAMATEEQALVSTLPTISSLVLPTSSEPLTYNPSTQTTSNNCIPDLWKHVYNPSRLKIINQCSEVSGTIDVIRVEKDGDDHILLKLDVGQENLLNQKNISQQKGDLVLEPVCIHNVTQADAVSSCEGFHSNVVIPPIGTHVKVIGSFVLDTAHGWNEIHPVSQITIE